MCGIFGICYTSENREDWTPTELAQILFPSIRHRGPHAFGWMTWNGEGGIDYQKQQGDVALMSKLSTVAVDDSARWMVGHVRYATHGSPEINLNNHPIAHGDVIGVHNGSIRNHADVLEQSGGRIDPIATVDSEAIFASVDRFGHRAGLRKLEGNMVTVYSRFSRPDFLYIARQGQYELVLARTPAGNLVFASELKVLQAVWGHELKDIRRIKRDHLLRIADGKVVESSRYQEATPKPPKPPSGRAWDTPVADRQWDGYRWSLRQPVAAPARLQHVTRAGSIPESTLEELRAANERVAENSTYHTDEFRRRYGKGKRRKVRASIAPRGYNDGDEIRPGLFYYNGLLLDEDDYVNAIADEHGYGDES